MTPIVIPLRQFGAENHLTLPAIPQTPVVTTVPQSRLMMSWWEREIKIWRIDELDSGQRRDEMYLFPGEAEERGRKLLSRIMLEVCAPCYLKFNLPSLVLTQTAHRMKKISPPLLSQPSLRTRATSSLFPQSLVSNFSTSVPPSHHPPPRPCVSERSTFRHLSSSRHLGRNLIRTRREMILTLLWKVHDWSSSRPTGNGLLSLPRLPAS